MSNEDITMAIILILGMGFVSIIFGAIFQREFRNSLFSATGHGSFFGLNVKGVTFLVLEVAFIGGLILLGLENLKINYTKSDTKYQLEGLVEEKATLKVNLSDIQKELTKLNNKNEKLKQNLISAESKIKLMEATNSETTKKDDKIKEYAMRVEKALKKIATLESNNQELEKKLTDKKDYLFADILTQTYVPLPGTKHTMRVVNVSMIQKKMQLMFYLNGDKQKGQNVYMVTGEITTVKVGEDKIKIKVLGVDAVKESAGLLISKVI